MTAELPEVIDTGMVVFQTPSGPIGISDKELFDILNERLDRIEQGQQEIRETMVRTEELVQKFIAVAKPALDDVIPMIASLAENPIISMLFNKKKEKKG